MDYYWEQKNSNLFSSSMSLLENKHPQKSLNQAYKSSHEIKLFDVLCKLCYLFLYKKTLKISFMHIENTNIASFGHMIRETKQFEMK